MKRIIILLGLLSSFLSLPAQVYYEEEKYASVNLSYTYSGLTIGGFDLVGAELTLYPSKSLGWEFSTEIKYGADYFSWEPVGIVGTLAVVYTQTHKKQFGGTEKLVSVLAAITSAKLPIYPLDLVEFTPYWSLFKLTKIGNDPMKVCGHVGLQLKVFPFYHQSSGWSTFYIAPFVQHDFGYSKRDGHELYWFDKESPFRGTSYGVKAGIYFW